MNADQTRTRVQNFLQLLTERNLDELINLFSENLDWYIPGDEQKAKWLGRRNTRKEVKEFYQVLWQNTEPLTAVIDKIFVEDDSAVITGEFSTKMLQTNNIVNSPFCIQLKLENGLIKRYRLLEDSYAVSVGQNNG